MSGKLEFVDLRSQYAALKDRIAERGLNTFVNTMLGPQNTSSSSVTASYTDTWFWIFTLRPMATSLPT